MGVGFGATPAKLVIEPYRPMRADSGRSQDHYRTASRSRSDLGRSKIASQSLLRAKLSAVTKNLRMPD
jgi:hypothetical protein